jgi:hypothetical protein
LPSGQLFGVFGPNSGYAGIRSSTCPVVGFEVEDVEAAREELAQSGVEFVTTEHMPPLFANQFRLLVHAIGARLLLDALREG